KVANHRPDHCGSHNLWIRMVDHGYGVDVRFGCDLGERRAHLLQLLDVLYRMLQCHLVLHNSLLHLLLRLSDIVRDRGVDCHHLERLRPQPDF
ncbi:hypothetical protein PFISCL1PPCAC_10969, partial [Pristionchus fissidentatus]